MVERFELIQWCTNANKILVLIVQLKLSSRNIIIRRERNAARFYCEASVMCIIIQHSSTQTGFATIKPIKMSEMVIINSIEAGSYSKQRASTMIEKWMQQICRCRERDDAKTSKSGNWGREYRMLEWAKEAAAAKSEKFSEARVGKETAHQQILMQKKSRKGCSARSCYKKRRHTKKETR